ncbi:MAG TPA: ABC transporter ATP-binding protein [Herpetosiphonaceae bacterium]|nr:ABC transporter ATP-binding protein [Herpetosiphonaceae bacterium]
MGTAITVEQLVKTYGDVRAVRGISFDVQEGEIFGFLGPNGAGKTTTIRCMLDLIRPTSGSVAVLGHNAQAQPEAIHGRIGYLPGDVRLSGGISGANFLQYQARLQGAQPVLLKELVDRFEIELKRPIKSYSKGMRQKVAIAQTFMCAPELVIMDEPTSGLDPLVQQTFNAFLVEQAARGTTIFMSSHIMSDVEKICGRVAVETVESLREKAGQVVTIEFAETQPLQYVRGLPGVNSAEYSGLRGAGHRYTLRMSGSMDALIKALARHEVIRLSAAEAPLEDIFMQFYQ